MRFESATTLRDGKRLRLRLPHARDRAGLARLTGLPEHDLVLRRLLRFDPRERAAVCAVVFAGGVETLVGYGAMPLGADAPDVLIADEDEAPGSRTVVAAALREHAERRRAA